MRTFAPDYEQETDVFSMNKETFETSYLPVYKSYGANPSVLIQFSIVLPFLLPFPEDMCHTMAFEDGTAVSLKFSCMAMDEGFKYGFLEERPSAQRFYSRVEMTRTVNDSFDEVMNDNEAFLNEAFDCLLENLNLFLTAYQVCKKDKDIYFLTKEMFGIAVVAKIIPVTRWSKASQSLFLLHTNISYKKEQLTPQELQEVCRHFSIISSNSNPFVLSESFILTAQRFFRSGFYQEAVVYAQTSVETFINSLFVEFLMDENVNEMDIAQIIEETPFMHIIKKEIPKRLGGRWDITKLDTAVARWNIYTYKLRNRIVHAGYRPVFSEVDEAICSATELRVYTKQLIELKKHKYPLLNDYFHNIKSR